MTSVSGLIAICLLEGALLLLTGLAVGRERWRLALAGALGVVCLSVPFLVPTSVPALRAFLGLASLFAVLRTIEIGSDSRAHAAPLRMFAYVAPLDALAMRRMARRLDLRGVAAAFGHGCLAALGCVIVWLAPSGQLHWPAATFGCVIALYGAMDAASALTHSLLLGVGLHAPPVQSTPVLSRSIAEFWGRRWNGAVGGWLRKHCFLPLARRRHARLGVLASFGASGALHFWPVLIAAGTAPAAAMGLFFVIHGGLVLLETRLGVSRWAPARARAWTVTAMLVTSPLFAIPVLLACGVS